MCCIPASSCAVPVSISTPVKCARGTRTGSRPPAGRPRQPPCRSSRSCNMTRRPDSPDPYDALPRRFNAAAHFVDRHVAGGRGERVALVCDGRHITYREVHAQVNRVGNALRRLGVRMEDRVPLLLPDGPEFVYAFWGAIKIGAVPVPLSPLSGPAELEYVLDDSRAAVVIVDGARVDGRDATSAKRLSVEGLVAGECADLDPAATTKDDVAFWLYTSGTTGTPKAA